MEKGLVFDTNFVLSEKQEGKPGTNESKSQVFIAIKCHALVQNPLSMPHTNETGSTTPQPSASPFDFFPYHAASTHTRYP